MMDLKQYEVWFVTGSQSLYGEETLRQVAADAEKIAAGLDASGELAVKVVYKPVVKTPGEIAGICAAANVDPACIGLITWMHTFSPAKMWIAGLNALQKPFVHLHTQYNRDIPWSDIDMDFMNLNQSAHGGREFGFIGTRMGKVRKVIVGHWEDPEVRAGLDVWMRAAAAWADMQTIKVARFGDNMREVAVTEGDKVAAQIVFGYSVNGYGLGDLVAYVDAVADVEIDAQMALYAAQYDLMPALRAGGEQRDSLKDAARIELGMRAFLEDGGFSAFTTCFEDLTGLNQLPGLAVQRLMADGYGFGAEGDWKTAALVRAMKVMGAGLDGGCSFMEDYTYHLEPGNTKVLGAHMLEVCPTIGTGQPAMEIHPLGIGGKGDPVRLVFNVAEGPAVNASVIDMGDRFRMLVNPVTVVPPDAPLPKLPVARVVWVPEPNLKVAAAAWILAGGAHHTGFSQAVTAAHLADFAEMANIECVNIDGDTQLPAFKDRLRWNAVYWRMMG
ncbi:MAG: L-arabinose isomerase [Anaerolineae bacterium]|nr:L-arabinose isomerase [Anaerolineae bacterium]